MAKRYRIFWIIRHTSPCQIWEENGGVSYSLNVAYLACWGRLFMLLNILPHFLLQNFFSCFRPLKPTCVLWSEKYGTWKGTQHQ